MKVEFNHNKMYSDKLEVRNELVVNGIITHTASPAVVFHSNVSKAYKKFEKKLNKHIGKKIKFTDTLTDKSYTGYYFGLCENTNGRDGVSYFLANTETNTKPFTTFPYGIINEFIYSIIE